MEVQEAQPVSSSRTPPKWARILGLSPIDAADRDNNFYTVRLLLAARVIFGHAFVLGGVALEAGSASFGRLYNSLGVNGFFVISGFLVAKSLLSSKTMTDYVAARVLRIVPALWVMLFVTVPLVVWLASSGTQATWMSAARYLIENMSIAFVTYQIDGVFDGLSNTAVNGSIWSLRWEVFCYAALALVGYIGLVRRRALVALMTAALVVALFVLTESASNDVLAGRIKLCSLFFFGTTLALYTEKILVGVWVGVFAVLVTGFIGYATEFYDLVYYAFGYLLISISYAKSKFLKNLTKFLQLKKAGSPDLSYGIFLYAFPIQQLLYYHNVTSSPAANIACTLVLTIICAYFSSQYVEKPTAALRARVVRVVDGGLSSLMSALGRPRPQPASTAQDNN